MVVIMENMRLVLIYGPPAAGKLTVAKGLAHLTGYKFFHNHLTVDVVLSVFERASKPSRNTEAKSITSASGATRPFF